MKDLPSSNNDIRDATTTASSVATTAIAAASKVTLDQAAVTDSCIQSVSASVATTQQAAASVAANTDIISKKYNIFRDTPIRYLGYANEVGESFRYHYPKFVLPSYGIAFGYCCADAIFTGYTIYHTTTATNIGNSSSNSSRMPSGHQQIQQDRTKKTMIATFDTLLWQSLASVLLPGYVIHTIVSTTRYIIQRPILEQYYNSTIPKSMLRQRQHTPFLFLTKWVPTITGLCSIPLIVHPIDHSVDYIFDRTIRIYFQQYLL